MGNKDLLFMLENGEEIPLLEEKKKKNHLRFFLNLKTSGRREMI